MWLCGITSFTRSRLWDSSADRISCGFLRASNRPQVRRLASIRAPNGPLRSIGQPAIASTPHFPSCTTHTWDLSAFRLWGNASMSDQIWSRPHGSSFRSCSPGQPPAHLLRALPDLSKRIQNGGVVRVEHAACKLAHRLREGTRTPPAGGHLLCRKERWTWNRWESCVHAAMRAMDTGLLWSVSGRAHDDYHFYLAFENSNCRHYVTEKLFMNALKYCNLWLSLEGNVIN